MCGSLHARERAEVACVWATSYEVGCCSTLAVFLDFSLAYELLDGPHELLRVGPEFSIDFLNTHGGLGVGQQLNDFIPNALEFVG